MRLRKPRQMPRCGITAALGTRAAAPSAGPGPEDGVGLLGLASRPGAPPVSG